MNSRRLQLVAASGLALICAGLAHAAGGYGPLTPPSSTAGAAGFATKVQAAKTFGRTGGTISAALAHGAHATVTVPAGAVNKSRQVAILAPSAAQLTALLKALRRPTAGLTGLGILIRTPSGKAAGGVLAKPLAVVIRGAGIGKHGQTVLRLVSATAAAHQPATVGHGAVSLSTANGGDFVVLAAARG